MPLPKEWPWWWTFSHWRMTSNKELSKHQGRPHSQSMETAIRFLRGHGFWLWTQTWSWIYLVLSLPSHMTSARLWPSRGLRCLSVKWSQSCLTVKDYDEIDMSCYVQCGKSPWQTGDACKHLLPCRQVRNWPVTLFFFHSPSPFLFSSVSLLVYVPFNKNAHVPTAHQYCAGPKCMVMDETGGKSPLQSFRANTAKQWEASSSPM